MRKELRRQDDWTMGHDSGQTVWVCQHSKMTYVSKKISKELP